MEEVGSKGMGEVEAKGMVGPVIGEGGVVGGTKMMVGREGLFPGGISSREETLDRGRARSVLVGGVVYVVPGTEYFLLVCVFCVWMD